MSVEATGWAWRQVLPLKPKFVLLKLADQTDERTGRVCYGKTDLGYLAERCAMPRRSLSRCISALIRNGYMIRESGKDRGHGSDYWLCLGRETAASEDEFKWSADPNAAEAEPDAVEADPQDVDGGGPNWPTLSDSCPQGGVGQLMAHRVGQYVAQQESTEVHLDDSPQRREPQPSSFRQEAQALEVEAAAIKRAANRSGAKVFVIEGTKAWEAWCLWRKQQRLIGSMPTMAGTGEHAGKRGWWLPALFPPSQPTGPPGLSAADRDFVKQQQGLG